MGCLLYFIGLFMTTVATVIMTVKIGFCLESVVILILYALGYFLINVSNNFSEELK